MVMLRWALFKDNLSFPGKVRVGDILSKLLQINSISAILCSRVLCSSGISSFLSELAYNREVDLLLRGECRVALESLHCDQSHLPPTSPNLLQVLGSRHPPRCLITFGVYSDHRPIKRRTNEGIFRVVVARS